MSLNRQISQAVRKRNGTKHRISKMIPEIKDLVEQRGSRSQIRFLKTSLEETLKSAVEFHEALMVLLPDNDPRYNDVWIDELSLNVNSCFGQIEKYLDSRKDDPPSSLLSSKKREDIQKWRENSRDVKSDSTLSDMCDAFSKLYVEPSVANETNQQERTALQAAATLPSDNDLFPMPSENEIATRNQYEHIETSMQNNTSVHDTFTHDLNTVTRSNIEPTFIASSGEHGGARPREPIYYNQSTTSIPTNFQIPNSPVPSTKHLTATYLNPNTDEFTPKFEGKAFNQLQSTYTIHAQNSSTEKIPFVIPDDIDPSYDPIYPSNLSTTLSPHENVVLSTKPPQATRTFDQTLAPHATLFKSNPRIQTSLNPHVNTSSNRYTGTSLNPQVNTSSNRYTVTLLNPHVNTSSNRYVNTQLNPQVNTSSNLYTGTSLNDQVNTFSNLYTGTSLNPHVNTSLTHQVNIKPSTMPTPNESIVVSSRSNETNPKSKSVHFFEPNHSIQTSNPSADRRSLDQWIDELDPNNLIIQDTSDSRNIQMELLIQQRLPRQELIVFSGEADKWIEFASKFYDIVHKQPYLDSFQKHTYLTQHLKGEALKSIEGFSNDNQGYVNSLKKLKYLFGNKVVVAQSVIQKITKYRQVPEYDTKALANFYFEISTCLNTLLKMNYVADIYSTDLLRQTLSKLPMYLQRKWSEYSLSLRRREEPNLYHLERWLQDRVMAARDPYLNNDKLIKVTNRHNRLSSEDGDKPNRQCPLCAKDHWLFRCDKYKSKSNLEKLTFVKRKRLCFNCLGKSHGVKSCKVKKHCFADGCKGRHHTSLHQALMKKVPDRQSNPNSNQRDNTQSGPQTKDQTTESNVKTPKPDVPPKSNSQTTTDQVKTTHNGFVKGRSHVYLQVVPVRVKNYRGVWIDTYAMLDTGSQCTLITKSLCKELKLQGRKTKINFGTIRDSTILQTQLVDLTIAAVDGSYTTKVKNVYSLNDSDFNVPGQEVPITTDSNWDYIRDLNFQDIDSSQVQLLIGADVPDVLISHDFRKSKKGYPYASKTRLGWTLLGMYDGTSDPIKGRIVALTRNLGIVSDISEAEYRSFWETESFGTEVQQSKSRSIDDQRNQEILDKETEFKDGHYVVPMLWKKDVDLVESKPLAERRLNQICRKFQSNPDFFEMYAKNISSYLEKGYIRKLSDEEALCRTATTWYIPHHGVTNVNKPGKVRMVFDAAAQINGESLNSNLFSGPDLLNSLLGVLLRFRRHRVAVVADIEAMFCQVRLKDADTDANRFLWRDDPRSHEPPDHYKLLVHIFGRTDSPCAATYALQRAAKDQANDFPPEVIEAILRNFYVDDLLMSYPNVTKAKETSHGVISVLNNKGFNLTKFQSNEESVLSDVPEEKLATQPTGIKLDDKVTSRALGVHWDLETDCFIYKVNTEVDRSRPCTKRSILKKTATIYDPLGLLTPITLVAKLLMQELWRDKFEWDEEVSKSLKKRYEDWLARMSDIASTVAVPRSLDLEDDQDVQLHIFCDASEKAFAALAYVRIESEGTVSCHILMSKSRVAPLKRLTLPRLELQGAVIAVRVKETIVDEIDVQFSSIRFWTDSSLNLQYINNESKRFKVFVANRVAEIRNHSEVDQWSFVPGKTNPVDIATRGDIDDDEAIRCWFDGPDFLFKDKADWPTTSFTPLSPDDKEIKKKTLVCKLSCSTSIVQFDRFSSWKRLFRVVAWVILLLQPKKSRKKERSDLSIEEEKAGFQATLKLIQKKAFNDDSPKELKGKLSKLDPYIDTNDGLMRVGGRLKQGMLPYAVKHQVILPKDHYAVMLLVRYYHEQYHHVGTEHLISLLRQQFWIIAVRTIVKGVIRKCVKCQKRKAKPGEVKMADLPADRITVGAPTFFHTGVDFFGPIQVKVLRSKVKRWGCLFTCLVTRAVHIEVSPSLEADDFINVLDRFMNRRGNPEMIRSDCGTNFKGATNELKKELERMDQLKIAKSLQRKEIKWHFNPPEAPHMGGVWERLVRSVKTTLTVILGESATINDFTLQTVLTEVEAILNCRPLTYVSNDPNDLEPLTPNHFLLGRPSSKPISSAEVDIRSAPRQKWKQVQSVSNQFWDRWSKEYLVTLNTRSKWQKTNPPTPKEGDLVMMLDKNLVRSQWTLGRIKRTIPSSDGEIRKVEVTTKDGSYVRPITKISMLELDSTCH